MLIHACRSAFRLGLRQKTNNYLMIANIAVYDFVKTESIVGTLFQPHEYTTFVVTLCTGPLFKLIWTELIWSTVHLYMCENENTTALFYQL